KQCLDGIGYGVYPPWATVDDEIWNATFVLSAMQPENRIHISSVFFDVRHHDNDVVRFQRGVRVKGGEKLIMQYFDFAQGTVGNVKLQGMISGRHNALFTSSLIK